MEYPDLARASGYKEILRQRVEQLKERRGQGISYQRMADACGIQKTYLSRLFNDGKTHLSADQLFLAMKYLGLSEEDAELTELFWNWERAGTEARRKDLRAKLDAALRERQKAEKVVSAKKVMAAGGDAINEYYLDPFQQLVHGFLMIPRYRQNPEAIARKLGLTQARMNGIIKKLLRMGLIEEGAKGYTLTQMRLHLTPDSPVYYPYRALMRLRSLDLMQRRSHEESYGLSVIFTGSALSRKKVQSRFLEFLKDVEKEVQGDPDEEVYQLNFDLVSWTD